MVNKIIIVVTIVLFGCNSKHADDQKCRLDKDYSKAFPTWKVYGLFDEKDNTRNEVSRKMGFKFKIVGGCVVDDSLTRAVKFNNTITDSILAQKYGKDWMSVFEARVDSLYSIDTTCFGIVRADPLTRDFINDTIREQNLYSIRTPYHNLTVICCSVYDPNKALSLNKFRATVDHRQKKIISLDTIVYIH